MTRRKQTRLQGIFQLPESRKAHGELLLKGRNSLLILTSHSEMPPLHQVPYLFGTTLDHLKVTCIDCVGSPQGTSWKDMEVTHYFAHVFPHFITVGDEHVDPASHSVHSIRFAVDDLSSLFYDFDAFGHVVDATPIIDTVLAEMRRRRPVETGENPKVAYFTGKLTVIKVDTDIGEVHVSHQPSFSSGGPDGVFIKNRMVVSIEPSSPITFADAIDRMLVITRFLSVMAGCEEGIHDIQLQTMPSDGHPMRPLSVYWSHAPKGHARSKDDYLKPHPGDVPLDPVGRPEEFSSVIKNWICRESRWRASRVRYVNCLRKGNYYDADRIIAAANMFDILPEDAVPTPTDLPDDLAESRSKCLTILNKHSPSVDRDSAISALKRMGKPSLPKKVQYRTAMVVKHFGARFEELPYIVKLAVQCRNYFVHGSADDFNFRAVEPYLNFLTDALEFVFAASDLIEAGWSAEHWNSDPHGDGHTFARFRRSYDIGLEKLKRAIAATP